MNCHDCKYWEGEYPAYAAEFSREKRLELLVDGTCRRFPRWEKTKSDHHCGEHTPIDIKELIEERR